jgi:ferric-dicitrate binding protein FerR (iron transport regulator)
MKKEYSDFTAIDFARDIEFLKWVKYPHEDEARITFWEDWLKQHPHKKEEIDEAKELIFAVLEQKYVPGDALQREVWNRIKGTLAQDPVESVDDDRKSVVMWRTWMTKAACVTLLLGVMVFGWKFYREPQWQRLDTSPSKEQGLVLYENLNSSAKTIVLSDGTSIVLQPNSSLKYPKLFKHDLREVYLTGEAFFEVKKDPSKPFIVHANELVTRVLGTSFTIRNFKQQDVLICVKTGKVSVFKEKDLKQKSKEEPVDGVVLTANQQVVYEREEMKLTKSLVEDPVVLVPMARLDFEFTDTPIKEVFQLIENAYGVDIVYDEEALSTCYLNASLSDVPLYDKLKLICAGINATYEMMDSHIIIYGKGCNE